jgi:hypothetical protein
VVTISGPDDGIKAPFGLVIRRWWSGMEGDFTVLPRGRLLCWYLMVRPLGIWIVLPARPPGRLEAPTISPAHSAANE